MSAMAGRTTAHWASLRSAIEAATNLLARKLQAACGLSPDELIVSLVENTDADWSFGWGRAQFLTRQL